MKAKTKIKQARQALHALMATPSVFVIGDYSVQTRKLNQTQLFDYLNALIVTGKFKPADHYISGQAAEVLHGNALTTQSIHFTGMDAGGVLITQVAVCPIHHHAISYNLVN